MYVCLEERIVYDVKKDVLAIKKINTLLLGAFITAQRSYGYVVCYHSFLASRNFASVRVTSTPRTQVKKLFSAHGGD